VRIQILGGVRIQADTTVTPYPSPATTLLAVLALNVTQPVAMSALERVEP
jgi:DNA-binding SARP family transcriptional activator